MAGSILHGVDSFDHFWWFIDSVDSTQFNINLVDLWRQDG
jgi:hypothetical protein